MSDTTPGSWQPDPFGRFAQRYFDGAAWTANVIDASGQQSIDQPVSSVPSPSAGSTKRGPQIPALVVAGAGVVFTLLSLFVLNWFDFGSSVKDDLRSTSNSIVQRELGVSVSDVVDGLKFTEIKTISEKTEDNTLSGATDQYFNFGYLVAAAAGVVGLLALFSAGLQKPIAVVLVLAAAWHANTVNDLSDNSVDTKFGAWLGAVGLVMIAVALLLPRSEPAAAVS